VPLLKKLGLFLARGTATVGSTTHYPITALRTAAPAENKVTPASPRGTRLGDPRRMRRLGLGAVILLALGVVGFLSWSAFLGPVTVSIAPVATDLREQVFALGTIGARVQSNVGFKVSGVLVALGADQGDRVRAGQVLARLDARDVEAQLALAKAGVAQADANIEKAKADVVSASANLVNAKAIAWRRSELAKHGNATIEEMQTTDAAMRIDAANLTSAKSNVSVAEAALQSAEAQETFEEATLANYTLYAPYDAWIISRNLELGSAANPGQSVFTLVEAHTVWALGYVDERLAGRLRVGQPAEIILRSNPNVPIPGHVERIEIQSDAVNEERLVDVAFDKVPENIHLAEQAEVIITTGTLQHALAVAPQAVSDLHNREGAVWTVEKGRIERRRVTFGPELLDGRLPIIGGLPADAAVVAMPVSGLRVGRAAIVANDVRR
jgi:HlyD family secretion protein